MKFYCQLDFYTFTTQCFYHPKSWEVERESFGEKLGSLKCTNIYLNLGFLQNVLE